MERWRGAKSRVSHPDRSGEMGDTYLSRCQVRGWLGGWVLRYYILHEEAPRLVLGSGSWDAWELGLGGGREGGTVAVAVAVAVCCLQFAVCSLQMPCLCASGKG